MSAVIPISSSNLTPQPPPPEPGPSSFLGSSVAIKGRIVSQDDIYIDGVVEGSIEAVSATVTVGPNAKLAASILARTVVLSGAVEGPVTALQNIDLKKGCKLIGNVTTSRIAIEDGAYLKGSIDIGGQINRTLPQLK